ncbi:MAG: Bifunctional ribokinase/ribose-5-phosphate isomerase A [bacterium]|nr:Bifunctional ribokinase/ribose-5-phosphate isomerase A [bacterium]NUM67402.1 ribokinase [candidate division KSB1 bacterium]
MLRNGILVVGSANMDMVVVTKRPPQPGETVFGNQFAMFPGGKGANQAVCCAKLGGRVHFIGKMGNDVFRAKLLQSMKNDGVRLQHLLVDPVAPTGIALITVDARGQNEIVVVSGSNMKLTPADLDNKRFVFAKSKIVLLQLEIPIATVTQSARLAKAHGVTVILNPAPARKLPKSLLQMVDYLTPNETETEILTGMPVKNVASAQKAAKRLLNLGVKNVIITLGAKGCLLVNAESAKIFPARKVKAVDTTAAGDAFNGALAFWLAKGGSTNEAIRFANAVAAFSVTKMGAQSSMPTMKELQKFRVQ